MRRDQVERRSGSDLPQRGDGDASGAAVPDWSEPPSREMRAEGRQLVREIATALADMDQQGRESTWGEVETSYAAALRRAWPSMPEEIIVRNVVGLFKAVCLRIAIIEGRV